MWQSVSILTNLCSGLSRKDSVERSSATWRPSDWDGTPCTGRMSRTGARKPSRLHRPKCVSTARPFSGRCSSARLSLGKAIQAGMNRACSSWERPELFAGVIAGSETMIGQDFKTGKYLGYRALHQPGLQPRTSAAGYGSLEREKSRPGIHRAMDHRTRRGRGVSPQKIYSHICVPLTPLRSISAGRRQGHHLHAARTR